MVEFPIRGKPLFNHEVVVNLIAGTTIRTGLKIEAELDTNAYPIGNLKCHPASALNRNFYEIRCIPQPQ